MKRKLPGIILSFFAVTIVTISYNACMPLGFEAKMETDDLSSLGEDAVMAANGKALYAQHCAMCHFPIDESNKKDRNAGAISGAIDNIPQMASLKGSLSRSDMDAIAAALSTNFCAPVQLGKTTMRRMNFREFVNSTRDLLGNHSLAATDYPNDTQSETGFDNDGSALLTIGQDPEKIITAAEKVADQILADTSSKFNSCNSVADKATCFKNLLTPVIKKAFRVPVTAAEVQPFINFATAAPTAKEGARDALVAIMASPRFLFHVINYKANRAGELHTLSPHELASKLALFLWSSIPDDTLMQLADNGQLGNIEVQKQQVDRMLKDPKAQSFISSFGSQWLGYNTVMKAERSASMHPDFTPAVKTAMVNEANMMFADVISRELMIDAFVTANYTFVDKTLATYYGLSYPSTGTGYKAVMLDGVNRRGMLTQGAVMTSSSKGDYTDPIHRGKVFLDRVICESIGSPPAGIGELPTIKPGQSTKDLLASHRTDKTCNACHQHIDPMGLAWENIGATGKWRETDNGRPIDTTNETSDGFKFSKPGELIGWIASGDKFEKCVSQHLTVYANGRPAKDAEKCYSNKIVKAKLQTQGATFNDIIEGIVTSDLFKKSVVKE